MTDSTTDVSSVQPTHKAWVTTLLVVANCAALVAMAMARPKDWMEVILMPSATMLVDFGANFGPFTLMFGQGWRLLACAFLHKGVIHLVLNMIALWYLGSRAERLLGPFRFLIVCIFTAVGASLASLLWRADTVGVGCSGLVFGLIGLLVALGQREAVPVSKEYVMFIGAPGIIFASFATILGLIYGFAFADEDNFAKLWSMRATLVTVISVVLLGGGYVSESTALVEQNPTLQALGEEQIADSLTEGKDPKKDSAAYEAALKHLDKAIELNPQQWVLHLAKSQVLVNLKRFDDAIAECEKAEKAVDKDLEKIYFQESIVYHQAGRDDKAVECYAELISIYDKNDAQPRQPWDFGIATMAKKKALAYNNRAWSRLILKDYEGALQDVNCSLQLDSSMSTTYDTKGVILFYMNQNKDAVEALSKAIKIDSSRGECFWHRAQVYKAMGEESKAREDMMKAQLREYEPEEWELKRLPDANATNASESVAN